MRKKVVAIVLVIAMFTLSACKGDNKAEDLSSDAIQNENTNTAEEIQTQADEADTDVLSPYELLSVTECEGLNAEIVTYMHSYSGATVVHIKNNDPELAFGIGYRTPVVDETDTNHVFEHAIIASSEKYPSKDLFFDLANKTYSTFVNAMTYNTITIYPISSMSENQLMKMTDAYLSCMVNPGVLQDENFFKREAVRYQLYDKDEDIEMLGSVFAEDLEDLNSVSSNHFDNIKNTLFPNEYAANSIGKAHLEYQGLTYENTIATFDRCYHFDNSIIVLYGDLDVDRFLTFMDSEYLSKYPKAGTDLSKYTDEASPEGFTDVTYDAPAFYGDYTDNSSIITYAIDIDSGSRELLLYWNYLNAIEQYNSSVLSTKLMEAGISNPVSFISYFGETKTTLYIEMDNCEPEQKDVFFSVIKDVINTLATEGENQELVDNYYEQYKISNLLTREDTEVGIDAIINTALDWAKYGETDYLAHLEETFETFCQDAQTIIKEIASDIIEPKHSVLVTTVPKEGLADEIEEVRAKYLADMKASMSDEEIEKMIQDSIAFDEWNEMELVATGIGIDSSELEDVSYKVDYTKDDYEGYSIYSSEVDVEDVGLYQLLIDTSNLNNEEILYLHMAMLLQGMIDTKDYTKNELDLLWAEKYFDNDWRFEFYGNESDGYPAVLFSWYGLADDYNSALEMFINTLKNADYSDVDWVTYLLDQNCESFNPAHASAWNLTTQYGALGDKATRQRTRYNFLISDNLYDFYVSISDKLANDPSCVEEVSNKISEIVDKILSRGNITILVAANEQSIEKVKTATINQLDKLPFVEKNTKEYSLPEYEKMIAIEFDTSMGYSNLLANPTTDFYGKYAPFVEWINDKYIVPKLRFENGAYSAEAGVYYSTEPVFYEIAYSDPNVGKTIDVYRGTKDFMDADLTQDELDSYIIKAYSNFTAPTKLLRGRLDELTRILRGVDNDRKTQFVNDIKNAKVEDKDIVQDLIDELISDATIAFCSSRNLLQKDASYFEGGSYISYK